MALERSSWIGFIDQVHDGTKRRFNHNCGPGRTLLITQEAGKYQAFCFRCAEGDGYVRQRTLAELAATIRQRQQADASCGGVGSRPEPATYDVDAWPKEGQLWFYRSGLSRADIGALGAYYHEPSGRIVLPIPSRDGHAGWWQARAIEAGQVPKYLGPQDADRSRVCPRYGKGSRIVLTEDILSAYKVGKAQADAEGWCMMGTSLQPWVLAQILKRRCPVSVWLDPDPAGQRAAAKVRKELRLYGVACTNIVSERDPKRHTYQEIMSYVQGA